MNEPTSNVETGETLQKMKKVILAHFEDLVRNVIENSKHEPSIILLDHIPDLIDQLAGILREGTVDEQELGKSHGFQRAMLTDYSLADLLTEFSLLRETLIHYLYPMGNLDNAKSVHKFIDILSKHSTIEFINDLGMKRSFMKHVSSSETQDIRNNPVIDTN